MHNRRAFLHRTLAGAAAAPGGAAQKAAPRRRRILWNNDGDDLRFMAFGLGRLWTADDPAAIRLPDRYTSLEEFMNLRMTPLAGTQVDTLIYCGHFNWSVWDFPKERIAALGPDPLKPVVDFAHANGMEFFFSIRMNDTHSSFGHQGPAWWEPFRLENPHLLQASVTREEFARRFLPFALDQTKEHPLADVYRRRGGASRDYQSWSAYDYAHPEVRAYFLDVIGQACRRYDLEGIELDFLRHPFFFRFGLERRSIPVMNGFLRQVRRTLEEHAARRGRPVLLAVRVPDSPDRALAIGLDPEAWMADRCVDLLIAGNGNAPFSAPFHDWVSVGQRYGVPVYGCLDRMEKVLKDPAAVRAAALRAWRHGVDGIYFFNHFIPAEYGPLHDAGDPARLERANKLYRVDPDYTRKQNFTITPGQLPLTFPSTTGRASARLRLEIADQPGKAARVRLRTRWDPPVDPSRVRWTVNEQSLASGRAGAQGWIEYSGAGFERGVNRLHAAIDPPPAGGNTAATLDQVLVAIEYS